MSLKHQDAIISVFELMFEDWMDESDKMEFVSIMLSKIGKTFSDLDADIEQGVKNGHSVEKQLGIIKMLFAYQSSGTDGWAKTKPTKQGVYVLRGDETERGVKVGVIMKDGQLTTTLFDDYKNQVPVSAIPKDWEWKIGYLTDDQSLIWNSL